ncbi:MAG: hypothetical protein LBD62_04445 [Candidatus Margulisbacteria bacterium]|jgi:hypothetical protein|nr:hypothetical protein [Candidatus Margulisiibacteriota bacterium]
MQKCWLGLSVLFLVFGLSVGGYAAHKDKAAAEPNILPANKNIKINDRYSFQYEFPKKPRLGTAVLKILVYDTQSQLSEQRSSNLTILGSYDMPSMRGHHASPPQPIKTNRLGDYLFPVDLVMRGEWEIVLSFQENGQEIYSGVVLLKV